MRPVVRCTNMLGKLQHAIIEEAAKAAASAHASIRSTTLKAAVRKAMRASDPLETTDQLQALALKASTGRLPGKGDTDAFNTVQAAYHGLLNAWMGSPSEANRAEMLGLFARTLRAGARRKR